MRAAGCRLSAHLLFHETDRHPGAAGTSEARMPRVNLRISSERPGVIDRAAAMPGVGRAGFVLRSGEAAAIGALNESPVIAFDAPVNIAPAVKAHCARRTRRDRQHRLGRSLPGTTSCGAVPPSIPGFGAGQC